MYFRSVRYLVLLLSCGIVQVQAQSLNFFPVESRNGLSDHNIRNINQLPDGRMAVVTEGMLNLFNGSMFQYIHLNARNSSSLSTYFGFHHSYADREGRLWIKNYQQLMAVDLIHHQHAGQTDQILTSIGVKEKLADFFMDEQQNLWLLSVQKRLYYKPAQNSKAILFLTDVYADGFQKDLLYDLAVFKNQLFLFYRSGVFRCYDLTSRKEIFRNHALSGLPLSDYRQTLFIVHDEQHMYALRNGNGGLMQVYDPEIQNFRNILRTPYFLNTLAINSQKQVFVSCAEGLWSFSTDLKSRFLLKSLQLNDGRSVVNEVSTLYADRQGGLWVGTLNRGLLYTHPDRSRFETIYSESEPSSRNDQMVFTSFGESENQHFIGASNGLYLFSRSGKSLQKLPGWSDRSVYAMAKDQQGKLWMGTNQGLFFINGGKFSKVLSQPVSGICPAKNDKLYLCLPSGQLVAFDTETSALEYHSIRNLQGEQVQRVNQLVSRNHLLFGIADQGLFIYDPKKRQSVLAEKMPSGWASLKDLNHQQFNCLLADRRGLLWLGTQDGLYVWDEQAGRLTTLYDTDGLVNNMINGIAEDSTGSVWIATANGISKILVGKRGKNRFSFNNYNALDGVMTNGFTYRAIHIDDDGDLFLGARGAFNKTKLTDLIKTGKVLEPLLVSFELFGKEIKEGDTINGLTLLPNAISSTSEIHLRHHQNFITLGFSGLNYVNPSQTYYQYKLEGVDQTWQSVHATDGLGHANYTDLSPGTYLFKVRAADNNKQWNGPVTQVKIIISPPWWLSWPAIVVYVLVLSVTGFIVISWLSGKAARKRMREQKEAIKQMKFRFITNLSHELRTPLTLILTPLDVIIQELKDVLLKNQLKGIYHNALNLLNLINQLLDLRKIEFAGETLQLSYVDIHQLIRDITASFSGMAMDKQIDFRLDCRMKQQWAYLDQDKLRKMLNNLLSNAFKFTPPGGSVSLLAEDGFTAELNRQCVVFSVEDNGCGIARKDLSHVFDRFFQSDNQDSLYTGSGIGLHLVKEYAHLHQGKISVESIPYQFTRFTLSIPLDLKIAESDDKPLDSIPVAKDKKILVAEDHPEFGQFLETELGKFYQIIRVSDGRQGLDLLVKEHPDLIVSDLTMPVMDGLAFCKAVKTNLQSSHIPFVMLTARSSESAQVEGYDVGADAYIFKPFNLNILLLRIRNLLEQQEQRKRLFKKSIIPDPNTLTINDMDEALVKQALKCVEQHIANSAYSVEQFSADMNMDRTGLYRKMVAVTGQSPSEFMRSVRLKKAARLILEHTHSISEIAALVGFNQVSHFSKCFQDEYGVRPSQFSKETISKD